MPLSFENKELTELMEDFYVLTGMKIALFDENYTELIAYPDKKETFCTCMRKNEGFNKKCRESDEKSFDICHSTKKLNVYKCHAGLTEATAPIVENGKIIGYMMFGQVRDNKDKAAFAEQVIKLGEEYGIGCDLSEYLSKIKYKNSRQILAASKILDACTGYVRLKNMVRLSGDGLVKRIERFIDLHISEEITVERLCNEFYISRTRLYGIMRTYLSGGIAEFIRKKRLEKAKELLENTDMAVPEIAEKVGFKEYNYFLRVFKKEYGMSTKKYLKSVK